MSLLKHGSAILVAALLASSTVAYAQDTDEQTGTSKGKRPKLAA
jgi:hypothetical protein